MKILMLVPFLPNTSMSGGQTRWYNIIKLLSKKHKITLFTLIKDEEEKKFIPELEKYCEKVQVFYRSKSPFTFRNLLFTAFSYYPLLVVRNFSPKEKKAIEEELAREKYDLIHAETFYVMPHLPNTNIPSVLVEQTIEYQVYKHYVDNEVPFFLRPIFMIDVMKLKFWERYFWKKAGRLVAVSAEDKKIMQKEIPGISVDIIPNGVDAKYFNTKKYRKKFPPRVMYGVTNFEWLQNVEAVNILINKVWPRVRRRFPNSLLWIVGRKIPQSIVDLAKKRNDIEITESIKDAREAYKGASVMIAPIRGSGGTRLKVLEAMAAGLPVVSTSIGVAGLGIQNNKEAVISDSVKGLANEAVKLLQNRDLANKIGNAGRCFVEKNFDWEVIVKLHDKIYEKAIKR